MKEDILEFKIAYADVLEALELVNRKMFVLDTSLLNVDSEEALSDFELTVSKLKKIVEIYD